MADDLSTLFANNPLSDILSGGWGGQTSGGVSLNVSQPSVNYTSAAASNPSSSGSSGSWWDTLTGGVNDILKAGVSGVSSAVKTGSQDLISQFFTGTSKQIASITNPGTTNQITIKPGVQSAVTPAGTTQPSTSYFTLPSGKQVAIGGSTLLIIAGIVALVLL